MNSEVHTFGGVTATLYYMDLSSEVPRHQHPVEHTTQVIKGQTWVEIFDGRESAIEMNEGDFLVLPANIDHRIRCTSDHTIILNMIESGAAQIDYVPPGRPGDFAPSGVVALHEDQP